MRRDSFGAGLPRLTGFFATGFLLSAVVLAWLGFRAVSEWQRSARQSGQYRAEAAVDVLTAALSRDMRALQVLVLPSALVPEADDGARAAVRTVAAAFAKYPYAEAFFSWDEAPEPSHVTFFSRADRRPSWVSGGVERTYPLVVSSDAAVAARLMQRIDVDARRQRQLSTFDLVLGETRYQVVAAIRYGDSMHTRMTAVRGFTVNMDWIRRAYYPDVAAQLDKVNDPADEVMLSIADGDGAIVGRPLTAADGPVAERTLAALFFDPIAVAIAPPGDLRRDMLTVRAVAAGDPLLQAAGIGTRRAWIFGSASAAALGFGFILTLQGLRAKEHLAAVRAEFVSSVTHELKAPTSTISAIGETFYSGRASTPELTHEYGRIVFHEAKRLGRLIDNLLAYSRIADVTEVYSFVNLEPGEVIDDVLRDFGSQLKYEGFQVHVEVAEDLPAIRADRRAMSLVLGNLLENAIRYSPTEREIRMEARRAGRMVEFTVVDRGMGINAEDLPHVTQRFYRGKSRERSGTGLGLAIVERIVRSHHGRVRVESTPRVGTSVHITIPAATA